jgi:hypothetical protein
MRRVGLRLAMVVALVAGVGVLRAEAGDLSPSLGVGIVDPNGAGSALFFTASAQRALGERAVLDPEIGYWSRKDSSPGVENALSDVSVGVNVLCRLTGKGRRARTRLFAGAGLGVHLVQSKASVTGFDEASETEVKQGIHLIACADRMIGGSLRVFVAVRSDLVADLPQSKIYAGVRLGR